MDEYNVYGAALRAGRKAPRLLVEARGSVCLVTNAHSELGRAFVQGLLERGAAKIYAVGAAAGSVADDRVHPLRLDLSSPAAVTRAAHLCHDVNLLVAHQPSQRSMFGLARRELDSTVYTVMRLARAFAPRLARNGGGGLVNVFPSSAGGGRGGRLGVSAVGAAAVAVTEALRMELRAQGTAVLGVHPGDAALAGPVLDDEGRCGAATRLVRLALDGLREGQHQVFADSPADETCVFRKERPSAVAAIW